MGLFDKIKQGLSKTRQLLNTDIRDLFRSEGRLVDENFLDELFEKLIKTDMGVKSAEETVETVQSAFRGRVVQMSEVLEEVKEEAQGADGMAEPIRHAARAARR